MVPASIVPLANLNCIASMADDVLKYPLIWLRDILGSDDEFIVDASIKKCFTKVVELGLNNLTVAAKQSSLLFAEEPDVKFWKLVQLLYHSQFH